VSGRFCTPRIIDILSRELNLSYDQITKFGRNSKLIYGDIDEVMNNVCGSSGRRPCWHGSGSVCEESWADHVVIIERAERLGAYYPVYPFGFWRELLR